ncbi:MAG TPA: CdaR family protein [Verrucomicrobiae bacterium]|nr:CdaR family protein [Verrucomicrobiae bacterium]
MKLRDLILHNFWWKLVSLLVAIIVWSTYYIGGGTFLGALTPDDATSRFEGYRPRLLKRQSDIHRYQFSPEEVTISFSGARELLDRMTFKDIVVYVDVQDYLVGATNSLAVQVRTPPNVKLVSVKPDKLTVRRVEPAVVPAN